VLAFDSPNALAALRRASATVYRTHAIIVEPDANSRTITALHC
jgi:hypothetical protein